MTRTAVLRGLESALTRSPLQPLFLWRAARRLAVLAYHDVDDVDGFSRHLDHVVRRLHPVSMDEVIQAIQCNRRLPDHAVLVTFDDGDPSVLQHAAPLLRERGVPAVSFVVSDVVGTSQPLWWQEINGHVSDMGGNGHAVAVEVRRLKRVPDSDRRRYLAELRLDGATMPVEAMQLAPGDLRMLERDGIEIGNHTASHPILPQCDARTARNEIVRAHQRLSIWLGHPPRAFAYPNGDGDMRIESVLAELGYEAGFLFDHRLARLDADRRFHVSRLRVNSTTSLDRFRMIVSGLHPAIHHAIGRT